MVFVLLSVLIFICLCYEATGEPIEGLYDIRIEVFNQSFAKTYTCPPHQNCRFVCGNVYNACLNTTFQCTHNNSCILDCISEASCCFSSFECSSNSSCSLNCTGIRSCNYMEEFCGRTGNGVANQWEDLPPNCQSLPYQFYLNSVDATIGLTASVGFASVGYTVENVVLVPDGSVQLLVKFFPDDRDIQDELFSRIHKVGTEVLRRISPPGTWKTFPDIFFNKTHPLVVTAFFPHFNQFLIASMSLFFESLSAMLLLENVNYFRHNNTINVQLNVADALIGELDIINQYEILIVTKVFRYPNESFVKASSYQVGSTVYSSIQFYDWNCTAPAPFYGAACIGKSWNSFGNQLVQYEDIIATLLEHFGDLFITNILNILEGSLSSQHNLLITKGLVVIVNSTISVGDTLHVSDGTLQIDVTSNITANSIVINEGNSIIIKLDLQTYQTYISTGNITITPFKSNNVSGDFSQITFQGPNGTIEGCTSSSHEGNMYLVSISDCSNYISPNTPVLIGGIVGGVLLLSIVISSVYIGVRIYTFQKSMKALEDTPQENETNQKSKDTTIQVQKVLSVNSP